MSGRGEAEDRYRCRLSVGWWFHHGEAAEEFGLLYDSRRRGEDIGRIERAGNLVESHDERFPGAYGHP